MSRPRLPACGWVVQRQDADALPDPVPALVALVPDADVLAFPVALLLMAAAVAAAVLRRLNVAAAISAAVAVAAGGSLRDAGGRWRRQREGKSERSCAFGFSSGAQGRRRSSSMSRRMQRGARAAVPGETGRNAELKKNLDPDPGAGAANGCRQAKLKGVAEPRRQALCFRSCGVRQSGLRYPACARDLARIPGRSSTWSWRNFHGGRISAKNMSLPQSHSPKKSWAGYV